jgi:transcriptional regulator with XRE-family HTH domain
MIQPRLPRHALLDQISRHLNVPNDSALARRLGFSPAQISRVRNGKAAVSAMLLLRMHELTNVELRTLQVLAGHPHRVPVAQLPRLFDHLGRWRA